MSSPPSSFVRTWLVALLLAVAFTLWADARRLGRLEHVAELSRGDSEPSAASRTGYAGGIRERVLPDHDGRGYEWIAQTQRMLAEHRWRVRRIEEENAPFGRPSHAASPYRWWLALVAAGNHFLTGNAAGHAVERAAVYADPLLHLLLLLGVSGFAARYCGGLAGAVAALGAALLFPFAVRFLPGAPDEATLEALGLCGSLLPLLAGLGALDAPPAAGRGQARAWFSLAGICGGLGFWINPAAQAPALGGIALGALVAARLRGTAVSAPWRTWSVSGAVTILIASLVEFFPHDLAGWELRSVHPLYGLGWLGLGELLARMSDWLQGRSAAGTARNAAVTAAAALAVLAVPFALWQTGNPGFLAVDSLFFRLTNQPAGAVAPNLVEWLRTDGFSLTACATLLPLLFVIPPVMLLCRKGTAGAHRALLALALGPAAIFIAIGCFQLRRWLQVDVTLLVLLVATAAGFGMVPSHRPWPLVWLLGAFLVLLPGVGQILPEKKSVTDNVLSVPEAVGIVERDLAHWLALHGATAAPPLVLAPPVLTTTLNYYGGLRGIGTLSWENREGLSLALRIVISTSRNETAALLRQRGVTHIVVPSWDRFFDPYVRAASVQNSELFYVGLNRWNLPPWLRPVPYPMPSLPGFENQSVRIFEVVDDQDASVAASRLTEYFLATGRLDEARISYESLLKYPADFGALVARAQLWAALGDGDNFGKVFESLLARLAAGADRYLPWDRRVSLAIVLARGNRPDLARPHLERCLADLNEIRLRTLAPDTLYRLLALSKAAGLEIANPALRPLARELLPEAMRPDIAP